MKNNKNKIIWTIYFIFLGLISYKKLLAYFSSQSPLFLFFYFLRSFDAAFNIAYLINIIQAALSFASLLPAILWVYQKRLFSVKFWQMFFIVKIIFDIFGQQYEKLEIISFFKNEPVIGSLLILQYFLVFAPLYIAFYLYAFKNTVK